MKTGIQSFSVQLDKIGNVVWYDYVYEWCLLNDGCSSTVYDADYFCSKQVGLWMILE